MPAKNINLLPRQDFDRSPLGRILRWSLTYGRYIIICTEIIVLMAFIYRFSLDRKITDLNEEIDQKAAIVEANLTFEYQFRNLQARTRKIAELIAGQNTPSLIMKQLETITPKDIQFSKFSYNGETVTINASARSDPALSLFLNNLNQSPFFTNINVTSLSKIRDGTTITRFMLTANARSVSDTKTLSLDL